MNRIPWRVCLCATLFAVPAGCSDPYVARAIRHDQESIQWAVGQYVRREKSCPANMRYTWTYAEEQWAADRKNIARDGVELERAIHEDADRWNEHSPEIEREFQAQMHGDPEKAAWTLPRLFF